MFIHIGAFVGEITILFVCMLWLKSEINVHLSYVHSVCFVYLSYFLEYIFCLPMLLFHVYILSIWVTFSRILFGITRIAPPPPPPPPPSFRMAPRLVSDMRIHLRKFYPRKLALVVSTISLHSGI